MTLAEKDAFYEQIRARWQDQPLPAILARLHDLYAQTTPHDGGSFNTPPRRDGYPDWTRPCPNWAFQHVDAEGDHGHQARAYLTELTGLANPYTAAALCRERVALVNDLCRLPGPVADWAVTLIAIPAAATKGERQKVLAFQTALIRECTRLAALPDHNAIEQLWAEVETEYSFLDPNRARLR